MLRRLTGAIVAMLAGRIPVYVLRCERPVEWPVYKPNCRIRVRHIDKRLIAHSKGLCRKCEKPDDEYMRIRPSRRAVGDGGFLARLAAKINRLGFSDKNTLCVVWSPPKANNIPDNLR
jgi:hypothetical protein